MKGGVPNSVRSEAALRAKLEPVIPSDTRDTVKILVKYRYIQNYSEFFFKMFVSWVNQQQCQYMSIVQ